jgi:putative heme iron utilization protein
MSGLTDLQAAVTALQALQTTVINELQTLSAAAGDPDATVETLAQQINTSVAAIQAAIPAAPPASTPST